MASSEEAAMRGAVEAWGRSRWPTARVIHELQIGGCRIDLAFVCPGALIGVEIKSSRDTLDRLERQLKHYLHALPEVWVAFAPRWMPHFRDEQELPFEVGKLIVDHGALSEVVPWRDWITYPSPEHPDKTHTAPMLGLLLKSETAELLTKHSVPFKRRMYAHQLIELAARKLTGDQIVQGVCEQLRARPCGWIADEPIKQEAA